VLAYRFIFFAVVSPGFDLVFSILAKSRGWRDRLQNNQFQSISCTQCQQQQQQQQQPASRYLETFSRARPRAWIIGDEWEE